MVLDECFLGLAREVLVGEVVPAEAGDLVGAASEAGADGGVMGDAAAEQISNEVLDGVGFGECHRMEPSDRLFNSSRLAGSRSLRRLLSSSGCGCELSQLLDYLLLYGRTGGRNRQ